MNDKPLDDAAIRTRLDATTPGPWWAWDRGVGWVIAVGEPASDGYPADRLPEGLRTDIGEKADAEFIAHARQDVPALLAELAQLRRLVDDIYHFHTDSPAGVCPSCGRIGEQSDTDDGLVNWPCPTVQAIERVVGDHTGCPPVVEDRDLTTASRSVAAARRLLGLDGTT